MYDYIWVDYIYIYTVYDCILGLGVPIGDIVILFLMRKGDGSMMINE